MLTSTMFSAVSYFSQELYFYHPCMVIHFLLHVLHELSFFHKIKTMLVFNVYIHADGIDRKETEQNCDSLKVHLLGT